MINKLTIINIDEMVQFGIVLYTVNADIARDELTFYEHIQQRAGGWSCMLIQLLLLRQAGSRTHEKAVQLCPCSGVAKGGRGGGATAPPPIAKNHSLKKAKSVEKLGGGYTLHPRS